MRQAPPLQQSESLLVKVGRLGLRNRSAAAAATAVATTVAKSVGVGEARPPGFVKHSATSEPESELPESSDEARSDEDEATRWVTKRVEAAKIGGKWQYRERSAFRELEQWIFSRVQSLCPSVLLNICALFG